MYQKRKVSLITAMLMFVLTLVSTSVVQAAAPQVTYNAPSDRGFFLQGRNYSANCSVTNNPTFVGFFYGNGSDPWNYEMQESLLSGTTWGATWSPSTWVKPQNENGTWYWEYTAHYAENADGNNWPYRYSYVTVGEYSLYDSMDSTFNYYNETNHQFANVGTGTGPAAHGTANTYNCLAYSVGITDHWEWPWSGTPTYSQLQTYMSNHGLPTYSTSPMPWTKVIYYNGDHFAKVSSWDSAGNPLTIRSKWSALELINSGSYNPFSSDSYGTATYYFK